MQEEGREQRSEETEGGKQDKDIEEVSMAVNEELLSLLRCCEDVEASEKDRKMDSMHSCEDMNGSEGSGGNTKEEPEQSYVTRTHPIVESSGERLLCVPAMLPHASQCF